MNLDNKTHPGGGQDVTATRKKLEGPSITRFKFKGYYWSYDRRKDNKNPQGIPEFAMFQDQESVHLEAKYHEFQENGGQLSRFLVDAGHWVDFSTMRMISVHDESDQREIQRGEQGKRRKRPSAKKFLNDANFNLNKFMAVNKDW